MALLLATKGLRAIVLTFARVCTILAKALICFCTFSLISKIALVLHIMTCDALRGPYWFTAIGDMYFMRVQNQFSTPPDSIL